MTAETPVLVGDYGECGRLLTEELLARLLAEFEPGLRLCDFCLGDREDREDEAGNRPCPNCKGAGLVAFGVTAEQAGGDGEKKALLERVAEGRVLLARATRLIGELQQVVTDQGSYLENQVLAREAALLERVEEASGKGSFLRRLRALNLRRQAEVSAFSSASWNVLEWAGAICGEAGELANVAKKIRRGDGIRDGNDAELVLQVGQEAADVVIYLDLLLASIGFDLEDLVAEKFDLVWDRHKWAGPRFAPEKYLKPKPGATA